ncbi:MAG: SCO family protein [Pirellulales bacterium]|jgi:cytochrome oxidase Cu insertion factor (SCO1/SenC/PrrC family)
MSAVCQFDGVTLPLSIFMLMLALSGIGCQKGDGSPEARVPPAQEEILPAPEQVAPGKPFDPFAMTDQRGEPFDSKSLEGKVWIGSIFFSSCPGPCFRENQALAEVLSDINDPDLMAVSITCDPENDLPNVLDHYAQRFEADADRWKFLTGDMEEIKRIANTTFFLPAEVGVHSERGVIFDRQGRLRGSFHLLQPDRVAVMKKTIRDLLAEDAAGGVAEATAEATEQ